MTRRIYRLIAIAWCLIIMPAAWADDQDSNAGGGATKAVPSQGGEARPTAATAQESSSNDERLKVFGLMPLHKPQPTASTGTATGQTAIPPTARTIPEAQGHSADVTPSVPAPGGDEQPAAEEQAVTVGTDHAGVGGGQAQSDEPAASPHKDVHWSYSGAGAPQFWGDLKPGFATCGNGRHQSPIDISTATITALPKMQFDYHDTPLRVVNNGHSIQVNYQQGSAVVLNGKRYDLIQFHFHTPSEHTMGGKAYPMVVHLVHKAADGTLLVVVVLMQAGDSNPLIARIWQELPSAAGQIKVADEQSINVADLLPKDATYFTYTGSLTAPPCTEGVKWVVLAAPVTVSKAQVDKFAALFPHNARPVEPLNGRTVLFSN